MKLIANRVLIEIVKDKPDLTPSSYQKVIDAKLIRSIDLEESGENAIVIRPSQSQVLDIISWVVKNGDTYGLNHITIVVAKPKVYKTLLINTYSYQNLGGGLVQRDNKFLLIFENGKWALPKGKLEKGELLSQAAQREVEEETGLKIQLQSKLVSTYKIHGKDKLSLKQYHWFLMSSTDRLLLKPSLLEGVIEAKWYTRSEIGRLYDTLDWYVEEVLRKYDKYMVKKIRKNGNKKA